MTNLRDVPVPGDYDGIGRTEMAVFRPSTAQWYVQSAAGGRVLATYGGTNFFDFPSITSVGSLKKLGTAGGIHIASLSVSAPFSNATELVAPPASLNPEPLVKTTAMKPAHKPVKHQTRHRDIILGQALDGVLAERVRRGR